ncbi:hypothetical protein [Corynebacterium lizhenjunii]|uniref:hypothetical protein n=1 Tax=Corynebacterium lizhenjunii TaxID=2709394 RepID=UPI0013ED7663|nr:hypothetical protein [Corynebacterium lizhenjunii]
MMFLVHVFNLLVGLAAGALVCLGLANLHRLFGRSADSKGWFSANAYLVIICIIVFVETFAMVPGQLVQTPGMNLHIGGFVLAGCIASRVVAKKQRAQTNHGERASQD